LLWLLENEVYHTKLIKEALKRASQEEKLQYAKIQHRKVDISQRITEISSVQDLLSEEARLNVLPEKPRGNLHAPLNRQAKEAAQNAESKKYREALEAYRVQNSAVLAERLKLMQQFLDLKAELEGLEETEKWLLLSMAIRNQSSLIGFIQSSEDSDK
jgi:hypothetical protein